VSDIIRAASIVRPGGAGSGHDWGGPTWTTAEGETMLLCDMETTHLFNSMKMCFNHLAVMWGGKPVWFTKQYCDIGAQAVMGPEFLAKSVVFSRECPPNRLDQYGNQRARTV